VCDHAGEKEIGRLAERNWKKQKEGAMAFAIFNFENL